MRISRFFTNGERLAHYHTAALAQGTVQRFNNACAVDSAGAVFVRTYVLLQRLGGPALKLRCPNFGARGQTIARPCDFFVIYKRPNII